MLHALLLGLNAHADAKLPRLSFARADAEELAALLRHRVEDERHVTLLVDEEATKSAVERVLTEELPRRVTPGDVVLLYFAGHGAPDIDLLTGDPSLHLVLYDTEYASLFSTAINVMSELSAWLKRLPARLVTVVFDTSFNGAQGGRSFEGPGLWSGPRTRQLERLSARRLAFGSRCAVLSACTDKELAREDAELRHGVFTYHLLEVLRRPALSGEDLTLQRLHGMVAEAVERLEVAQSPVLQGSATDSVLLRMS